MDGRRIPEEVRHLLRDRVSSYEELEILLLLAREPGIGRTPEVVGELARVPALAAAAALERLRGTGLIEQSPGDGELAYRYRPDGPFSDTVDLLVRESHENPVEIIKLMSANAIERIRMSALVVFADAFVLRSDTDRRDGDKRDG
ncbi:MAG TPA: hypothetical protein VM367_15970 [Pseudonocardia sp.]|jgi:hypothetical protein|nr:hypothetical protein [Pseudonocardia sp.]